MEILNNRVRFLIEKIQSAIRSINPFEGEREAMFTSLFPLVPSGVLWSEYRKRRESDFQQFLTKYERPEKIHKGFKIMKEMTLHDVRVITQKYPIGLEFLGIASLTSLMRELYLDTLVTNIQTSVSMLLRGNEKPNHFQLKIETISNIVSNLSPGMNVYLVHTQKSWIFRQATIVKATPGNIYLTYRDCPDQQLLIQISYVPEVYIEWDSLLPLMNVLVPLKEQGYFQVGEIISIRAEEITVVFYVDGERKKENLSRQLYPRFLLGPSTHGLQNMYSQIYCYVLLLQDYIDFIINHGRENGEDNLEADLKRKTLSSVFNSLGNTISTDLDGRWSMIMKYMDTLPDGEDRIIKLTEIERKVFGTIDLLAPQIMTAIKNTFINFYIYLTDTNRGTVGITCALGTYLYLTQGTYIQDIGKRLLLAYQSRTNKTKSTDMRITEEYFRSTCEIELYESSFIESVIRECICVFRVTAFTHISLQDWSSYKPYYDSTRCTDGIKLWSTQLLLLAQSLTKYIGDFCKVSVSRYILRKTLYESILTLSSLYMVITPSRARTGQYKIDVVYIVSYTLYYLLYSEPILSEDKTEDVQTNYHEQILNCCRKMLARAVLICGLWQNVVSFLQYLTKEPSAINFYEDTNVKYSLHQLLKIKKIDMLKRDPPHNFLTCVTHYFTNLNHKDITDFEINVYELICNRFELTAEPYPSLTEQQEEGIQPLKASIALFEASFIHKP